MLRIVFQDTAQETDLVIHFGTNIFNLLRHYNDWVLAYTREHGLATKDNNAMAEQHKRERYEKRNQELADAIRSAAGKCGSFRELVSTLPKRNCPITNLRQK